MGQNYSVVHQRLIADGIGDLDRLLTPQLFLAGSYLLERYRHDEQQDVDLWVPYSTPESQDHLLATVIDVLLACGYTCFRCTYTTKLASGEQLLGSAYSRVQHMVRYIYTCHGRGKLRVQVIALNQHGGSTAADVVGHFDLSPLLQYYHSGTVVRHPRHTSFLRFNMLSTVIHNQSFVEWCRSYMRYRKYVERGLQARSEDLQYLHERVEATLSSQACWLSKRHQRSCVYVLNVETCIRNFNEVSQFLNQAFHLPCPHILYTLAPVDAGQPMDRSVFGVRLVVRMLASSGFVDTQRPNWTHWTGHALHHIKFQPRRPHNPFQEDKHSVLLHGKLQRLDQVVLGMVQEETMDDGLYDATQTITDPVDQTEYRLDDYMHMGRFVVYVDAVAYGVSRDYLRYSVSHHTRTLQNVRDGSDWVLVSLTFANGLSVYLPKRHVQQWIHCTLPTHLFRITPLEDLEVEGIVRVYRLAYVYAA